MFKGFVIVLFSTVSFVVCAQEKQHVHDDVSERERIEYKHKGEKGVVFSKGYRIVIDTKLIQGLNVSPNTKTRRIPREQLDQVWAAMKSVLPNSTAFSIRNHGIYPNGVGSFITYFESSFPDLDLSGVDFVVSTAPIFDQSKLRGPRLLDYFQPHKWTKEKGYTEAKRFIQNIRPWVPVTFVIQELTTDNGESDKEAYSSLLSSMGVYKDKKLYVLNDGTRAVQGHIGLDVLNKLYNELKVINIVPDLSKD